MAKKRKISSSRRGQWSTDRASTKESQGSSASTTASSVPDTEDNTSCENEGQSLRAQHGASASSLLSSPSSSSVTTSSSVVGFLAIAILGVLLGWWRWNTAQPTSAWDTAFGPQFLPFPDPQQPEYRYRAGDVLELGDPEEDAARQRVYGTASLTAPVLRPRTLVLALCWWGREKPNTEGLRRNVESALGCPPPNPERRTNNGAPADAARRRAYDSVVVMLAGAGDGYESWVTEMFGWGAARRDCHNRGKQAVHIFPVGMDFAQGIMDVGEEIDPGFVTALEEVFLLTPPNEERAGQDKDGAVGLLFAPDGAVELLLAAANDVLRPFLLTHAVEVMMQHDWAVPGEDSDTSEAAPVIYVDVAPGSSIDHSEKMGIANFDVLAVDHHDHFFAPHTNDLLLSDSTDSVPRRSLAEAKLQELRTWKEGRAASLREEQQAETFVAPRVLAPQRSFSRYAMGAVGDGHLPALAGGVQFVPACKVAGFRRSFLPGWRRKAAVWTGLFAKGALQEGVGAVLLAGSKEGVGVIRRMSGTVFGFYNALATFEEPTHTFHQMQGVLVDKKTSTRPEATRRGLSSGSGRETPPSGARSRKNNSTTATVLLSAVDQFLLFDHRTGGGIEYPMFRHLIELYERAPAFAKLVDRVRQINEFYAISGFPKTVQLMAA